MDRIPFEKITSNTHRPRVDRFIAPREYITDLRRYRNRRNICCQEDPDIFYTKYHQKKNYINYLDHALGMETVNNYVESERTQTWPCLPRAKSYLSLADSVLDLPSYRDATLSELLDWSRDNILVAALGLNYHTWSWRSQTRISQGLASSSIYCCKFDPRGELLALGTRGNMTEIHSNTRASRLSAAYCTCYIKCTITTIDWSPTGNSFATGCSMGQVASYARNGKRIACRNVSDINAILPVRVSPDARYVAVGTMFSPVVVILSWPHLEMYLTLEYYTWIEQTLTWHPWRSALLGVGAVTTDNHVKVSLVDTPTGKIRDFSIGTKRHGLDAMLFSHVTGELVLSLYNIDGMMFPQCSQLVVMSDPDTVVDRWGEGRDSLDRIRTMVFSPDGTKLATATSEEDLIIWNFLPEVKTKPKKRFSAIPVYLDETSYGSSVR